MRDSESERHGEEPLAVLVDHSTDGRERVYDREGGEVTSKRPTVGKEKPGITFFRRELREIL